jgi:N-methylhydantoinase A
MRFLGVDTGGTFTDFVFVENGEVRTLKIPSTPEDPSRAFLAGLVQLTDEKCLIFHGSTVATNTMLENKGADVFFLVTQGFRDLLTLGRQNRPHLYALHPAQERLRLSPEQIIEVKERTLADGSILIPLEKKEIERIVSLVEKSSCRSVAICLLHSYANSNHEQQLEFALRKKGFKVSTSSHILGEYREFERASTTVVNAMVSPIMSFYLGKLEQRISPSVLKIMQSNGGTMSGAMAGEKAVHTILSGPAGGMVGAYQVASGCGLDRILTFDMGGTSTDVGLCDRGVPTTSQTVISGWPVKIPMIDIHTIGAGGGSIAWLDPGGALRVGPTSAGADPGPVCYGKGEAVTVTDANLFLGRLLPDHFLGGRMKLHYERCRQAVESLSLQAGLESQKLAEGIIEVVEENMAAALRVVSVERGFDPRDFTLLPFGGAGGLHACSLAEKLAIPRVFIPVFPGLLSALGMLLASPLRDYSLSVLSDLSADRSNLDKAFETLVFQARQEMLAEGVDASELTLERSADLRYKGQSFEINIPYSPQFVTAFHDHYQRLYGHNHLDREVEVVTLRLRALGKGLDLNILDRKEPLTQGLPPWETQVIWKGAPYSGKAYLRESLSVGDPVPGPALVMEDTATHLVPPGWVASRDSIGHLILEKNDAV